MSLPPSDSNYLAERGMQHVVQHEGNMTCIVLSAYNLPPGYDREKADLLIRLSAGYPDVPPDMWWFDPPVRLANGGEVPATSSTEHYLGRTWQRWSRHFNAGQWKSGVDSLESFLALIRQELQRYVAELVQ
jgi:hypothetical protein